MFRDVHIKKMGEAHTFRADGTDGKCEGFGMASLNENGELVLDSIHVIPKARKGGVGSSILNAMKKFGKDKGATRLTGEFYPEYRGGRDEEAARLFYEKHGIKITDDGKLEGNL